MAKAYGAGLLSAAAGLSHNAYADGSLTFPSFSTLPPSSSSSETKLLPPPKVRNDHPRTTSAGFDPDALERGVKALKEITTSPHGKKVNLFNSLFHDFLGIPFVV